MKRNIFLLTIVLFFPALALAAPATVTETATVVVNITGGPADRLWVDDDGVQHARDWPITADVFDGMLSPTGTQTVNLHWNIDPLGNGDFHGSVEREWTVNGVSGTFSGRFQATIENFLFQGTVVAKGADGFDGMKYKAIFTGIFGSNVTIGMGEIRDPSGQF